LAPGGADHLCDVVVNVPISQPQEISFECMIGAAGTVPQRFKLKTTLDDLIGGIERARRESLSSSDVLKLVSDA